MSNALLSLILDFAVLLALGGTVYYVMRLSRALENFRKHRDELKGLIVELTSNIDQAQSAINGLKAASNSAANDLDDVLHDSRRMAEELKIINETSDSLAARLENVATQKRSQMPEENEFEDEAVYQDELASEDTIDAPSFFIKDMDFEQDGYDDVEEGEAPDEFSSQAERELYNALRNNKRKSAG